MSASLAADKLTVNAWINVGLLAFALWIIFPICLFILGRILGQITLALARRSGVKQNALAGSFALIVRLLYRTVILIAAIYFYVSIPLIFFGAVAVVGGSIYQSYLTPANIQNLWQAKIMVLVLVLFVLAALIPLLFAMFLSEPPKTSAKRYLSRAEAPLLWNLVEEVAARAGTRPVNVISISSGSAIGVTEYGKWAQRLRGQTQRELALGFSVLPGMTQAQFKTILAHEYGHFSHGDTAGGEWAYKIRLAFAETMLTLREQIADTGFIVWLLFLILVYRFIAAYDRFVFMRITIGARRLHEIEADQFAAAVYGSANFAAGLEHTIHQSIVFDAQFNLEEQDARKARRRLHNLYTLPPLDAETERKIAPLIEKVMQRRTSIDDTHPAPQERIRLIAQMPSNADVEPNIAPVWDLLADAEALQMELTGTIQYVLYTRYGHSWAK